MKTSEKGINLIKQFEGCRLEAYQCAAGVWTIGYGHTAGVKSTDTITQTQAEEYLKADLEKYEKNVEKYNAKYSWNQNEFDALVSFAFNIGSIDKLTANGTRERSTIAEKMLLYNKAGEEVLEGLKKRRQAEQELFLTPVVAPVKQYVSKNKSTDGSGIIKTVQQWLNSEYGSYIKKCKACGNALLEVDGEFGFKTKAALTLALQIWINTFGHTLAVDGVFGEKTKATCKIVSEKTNANTRGAQIVQAILYCYKYNPQLFAETFNANCTATLKHYQTDHGLEPDGAAGKLFFKSALV